MKVVSLRLWEEVIGTFRAINKDYSEVSVNIGNYQIIFPIDALEAKIIESIASKGWLGKKVGFLRTDLPERPLLIRRNRVL
jgi:hypothetical protein